MVVCNTQQKPPFIEVLQSILSPPPAPPVFLPWPSRRSLSLGFHNRSSQLPLHRKARSCASWEASVRHCLLAVFLVSSPTKRSSAPTPVSRFMSTCAPARVGSSISSARIRSFQLLPTSKPEVSCIPHIGLRRTPSSSWGRVHPMINNIKERLCPSAPKPRHFGSDCNELR